MDITEKPVVRGRIAKFVLGLCLIVSALTRPEIALHVPGYLADLFVGPVLCGATGLTWALILSAGIGLLGAFRCAGFFAALAFVYNLIPRGSGLCFLPFVPTIVGALWVRGSTGLIIVHGVDLIFLAGVLGVEIVTAKPRSVDAAQPTRFRLAAFLVVCLLSGIAGTLPLIGYCVALFCRLSVLDYIRSADDFAWLFLLGGIMLTGGAFGVFACWRRLMRIARVRRRRHENDGTTDNDRLPENAEHKTKRRFQFSLRTVLLGVIAAAMLDAVSVETWKDAKDPLRYDRHLHGRIAWADRIVVRDGGFDCCGPVDGQKILFEVSGRGEIAEVCEHLHIIDGVPSGECMCCGYPGIDWYRGRARIALTSVQHGFALRWNGFPGDAHFTEESARWLRQWFDRHGFNEKKLESFGWIPVTGRDAGGHLRRRNGIARVVIQK